jgi:hypothetical protein
MTYASATPPMQSAGGSRTPLSGPTSRVPVPVTRHRSFRPPPTPGSTTTMCIAFGSCHAPEVATAAPFQMS